MVMTLSPKQNYEVSNSNLLISESSLLVLIKNFDIFNQGPSGVAFIFFNRIFPSLETNFEIIPRKYADEHVFEYLTLP